MRILPILLTFILAVPFGAAQSDLIFGTEEEPELPDGGPPSYSNTYTGAKDHEYLHIAAGWFSYDNRTDQLTWTLKVADAQKLNSPPAGWSIACDMKGNFTTEGAVLGSITFFWSHRNDGRKTEGVTAAKPRGGTGDTQISDIKHSFSSRFETPGYFMFAVNRTDLTSLGDEIQDLRGTCMETYGPTPESGFLTGPLTRNQGLSQSKAVYSFRELRQVRGIDGALDPIEEFERSNQTLEPSSTADPGESPSVGSALVIAMIAMAAAVYYRRR